MPTPPVCERLGIRGKKQNPASRTKRGLGTQGGRAIQRLTRRDPHRTAATRAFDFINNGAVYLGEQGVVLANTDVEARVKLGSALAHQDIACPHALAGETLDAESLRMGVAPVA